MWILALRTLTVGQDLGFPRREEGTQSDMTQGFSPPVPGTHGVLTCASVAGTKSVPARTGVTGHGA